MNAAGSKLFFILLILLSSIASGQTLQAEKTFIADGQAFLQKGELDKAIAEFDKAIKLNPASVEAFYFRGTVKYLKRDVGGAIFDYDKVIELAPKAPGIEVVYNNRGTLRYMKADDAGALADFEKAISINPNLPSPYNGRGNIFESKGELVKAFADFDKAIKLNPNMTAAYIGRADVRFQKGEMDLAIADYNKAIEFDPSDAAVFLRRGIIYGLKESWASAIADIKNGIKPDAQNRDASDGRIQVALADLDKYIVKHPTNAGAYAVRGFIRQFQGKPVEADKDFNKSFEIDPKLKIELDKFIKEAKTKQQ